MTLSEKENAEILKIKAETRKIETEVKTSKITEPLKVISALIIGFAGFLSAIYSWQSKDFAVIEEKKISSRLVKISASEDKTSINKIVKEYRDDMKDQVIYIHFRRNIERKLINKLRRSFEQNSIKAPGSQRILDHTSDRYKYSIIRYFHAADKPFTKRAKKIVVKFFEQEQCPLESLNGRRELPIKFIPEYSIMAPKGIVELWLYHNCG